MSRQLDQFGRPAPLSVEAMKPIAMGIAFAAFAKPETIQKLLGCSPADAAAFQETASYDFISLIERARAARKQG